MPILRPSRQELMYHKKAFLECSKLLGRKCKLIYPMERDLGRYTTSDKYSYSYKARYDYYIQLQDDPTKDMLEAFGYSKESSEKPLIALCPMLRYKTMDIDMDEHEKGYLYPANITEGCLITIEMYDDHDQKSDQYFTVEKVIMKDDSHYYTVNLIPFRDKIEGLNEMLRPSSGSKFIRQSDE